MNEAYLVVLTTLPSRAKAREISQRVLREKLAACINEVGPVRSSFWWKGRMAKAREYLLVIKTKASRFAALRKSLEKGHPYSVPEIIALPIRKGNRAYLRWLKGCC